MLGGVITAMVDCRFVLIDLTTRDAGDRGWLPPAALRGADDARPGGRPLDHLTPDPATAKVLGHRAAAIIGYGERVPNFNQVGQAVRQEGAEQLHRPRPSPAP